MNPGALGAICYANETNFGENTSAFATMRIPIIAAVDVSGLTHAKVDSNRTVQYRNDGTPWIQSVMGGSFKTKFYLPGHGSTTASSTTIGLLEALLGNIFGNATLSATAGQAITGGTASVPTVSASPAFTAGSLCRVGALGDGRGNGQFYAVASQATTSLTMLTALQGVPSNLDVLYDAVNIYPSEAPATASAIQSQRFLLQTANLCYEVHGSVPTAVAIAGLNPGEIPTLEVTWSCSWWKYSTATFPSTATTETFQPSPSSAGSLFINDFGTVTNAAANQRSYRSLTIDYKLGVELLSGPGGANQYQNIIGARRTVDTCSVSWMEDADAQTTTPVLDSYFTGTTQKHILATLNPNIGSAVGIYLPRVCITGARPIQKVDKNINRIAVTGMAYTSSTNTSDLTSSMFRMAFA